jgi:hypothetical protein
MGIGGWEIAIIADIARHRRDRKARALTTKATTKRKGGIFQFVDRQRTVKSQPNR